MAKTPSVPSLSNISNPEEFARYTAIAVTDLQNVVNGTVEFDSNIRSQTVEVSFPSANTDVGINHSLGRVPRGFIVVKANVATQIYAPSDFSSSQIVLRSSAICQATIIII